MSGTDMKSEKHGGGGGPENEIGPGGEAGVDTPIRSLPPKGDETGKSSRDREEVVDTSDLEVGTNQTDSMRDAKGKGAKVARFYRKFKLPIHVFVWMLFTA